MSTAVAPSPLLRPLWRLPEPSVRLQRRLALLNLICQIGIATTGVVVRVTASGLGCSTWPRCNESSFVPEPGVTPMEHQLIEFGNRLLTFVLTAAALALLLAVLRAARRRELVWLAAAMPIGILAQGVIGGMTVLLGLKWWTVALHLLPTMVLSWLAAVLYVRIRERDDEPRKRVMPTPLRVLALLSAVALTGVLVTGTMVTGAGPHAGDDRVLAADRLQWPIQWLVHFHAELMVGYLCLVAGLLAGILAVRAPRSASRRATWLVVGIVAQAAVGIAQYWLGVPAGLVVLHVTLAGTLTAVTASVWAAGVVRDPEVDAVVDIPR